MRTTALTGRVVRLQIAPAVWAADRGDAHGFGAERARHSIDAVPCFSRAEHGEEHEADQRREHQGEERPSDRAPTETHCIEPGSKRQRDTYEQPRDREFHARPPRWV